MKQRLNIYELNGLDCNSLGAMTAACDVSQSNELHVYLKLATGAATTFVLEVIGAGVKDDGSETDYFVIPSSDIPQISDLAINTCGYEWVKIRVKTIEGALSTVDIVINTYWTQNP
jgi:hypothetical protein